MPTPTIKYTSAEEGDLDEEALILAQMLSVRHGNVRVAREASGVHFYIASPVCLQQYGDDELWKMHLAINVEKYLRDRETNDVCALCMKTDRPYSMSDLLSMKNLEKRGFKDVSHMITVKSDEQYLEEDGFGNMVPKSPGKVIPITQLTSTHPVIQYVKSRNFDPILLERQFAAAYCYEEREDIFYRRLGGGFKATPQGRLIFYAYINGVRKGWQARVLEFVERDVKYYYHPYVDQWVPMESKTPNGWVTIDTSVEKWDPAKYVLAHGAKKNSFIMGYDAAVDFNNDRKDRVIGLTEGPLDAARLGPPFCAVMGKFLHYDQAKWCNGFDRVVLAMQNDEASEGLAQKTSSLLSVMGIPLEVVRPPEQFNDFGDMHPDEVTPILEKIL